MQDDYKEVSLSKGRTFGTFSIPVSATETGYSLCFNQSPCSSLFTFTLYDLKDFNTVLRESMFCDAYAMRVHLDDNKYLELRKVRETKLVTLEIGCSTHEVDTMLSSSCYSIFRSVYTIEDLSNIWNMTLGAVGNLIQNEMEKSND